MTDIPHRTLELKPLVRCSVLYIGSAVPLETVAGLDAFRMPLRERYTLIGGQLLGIDATLTVYSAGILVRYTADEATSVWFPIQALHVCAALKAFRTAVGGLDFASINSSLTKNSMHPPIFASINRRTRGVKVLECHMFVCKSVTDATILVQACINAYEQKEGWMDQNAFKQTSGSLPRIVPAPIATFHTGSGFYAAKEIDDGYNVDTLKQKQARAPLQGFLFNNRQDLIQKYDAYGCEDNGKKNVDETVFQVCKTQQEPAIVLRQPLFIGTNHTMTSSTSTSYDPVVTAAGFEPWTTMTQYLVPEGYLTGWKLYGSMPYMFVPASFYHGETHHKKKKHIKVPVSEKTRDKSQASTNTEEENQEDIIEEYYYVKPAQAQAPVYRPTVVGLHETIARDGGPRHATMPPYQTGSVHHTSRYTAGGSEQRYIISTPNIPRNKANLMKQQYLHGSSQHNGNLGRSDSQSILEPTRHVSNANAQPAPTQILEEPLPDYPTEPTDVHSDTRHDTGLPRISQGKPCSHQLETSHCFHAADKVDSSRDHHHVNNDRLFGQTHSSAESSGHYGGKLQSSESGNKRGFAQLVDDLGFLP